MIDQVKNNLDSPVKLIMTENIRFVKPDTILSEIARIFDHYSFHHLPVINKHGIAIGMISKTDYHKLQHHFTIFNYDEARESNQKIFSSLIAEEIMAGMPISLSIDNTIKDAIEIFLENKIHSLVITDKEKCVGIVTPLDILKFISQETE